MKKHLLLFAALIGALAACGSKPQGNGPVEPEDTYAAFPNAEGCGATATGGHGGTILVVSNLDDDGTKPGTLRYALNQTVPRIIIFRVAGIIELKSELKIKSGNVTIFGQSAPGDGICLKGYPTIIEADNVIVQFMRFRMGSENGVEGDALTCVGCDRVMIDHCSMSWSTDECASCYGNTNFTMQYCIASESLRNSVHSKTTHGYGGIWGGSNATFHHNLLAHHDSRNPRFDHDYVSTERGPVDFRNNVVYNWGGNSCYGGESGNNKGLYRTYNFVNNYYKAGPASSHRNRLVNPSTSCEYCAKLGKVEPGHFYITGNVQHGVDSVTNNNILGVEPGNMSVRSSLIAQSPYAMVVEIARPQTATEALETVLEKAGASYVRDAVDTRIVSETRNGSYTYTGSNGSRRGLIDAATDVGGWPEYTAAEIPADTDFDGMPDEWETANGLDPNSALDARTNTLHPYYTNLEVYLHSLVSHLY